MASPKRRSGQRQPELRTWANTHRLAFRNSDGQRGLPARWVHGM